ncbi:unnamed protein product [Adineta ricciae]|uniref:Uncharacterized protein n=1 Tax=Adineta ricciae TaxID=249248 RepID=A0A815JXT2_ADIRI|nr:unnamed protein product [Adineta ricciae]
MITSHLTFFYGDLIDQKNILNQLFLTWTVIGDIRGHTSVSDASTRPIIGLVETTLTCDLIQPGFILLFYILLDVAVIHGCDKICILSEKFSLEMKFRWIICKIIEQFEWN